MRYVVGGITVVAGAVCIALEDYTLFAVGIILIAMGVVNLLRS